MKIVIMAALAASLFAGTADAGNHSIPARHPHPRDYSALSLRTPLPDDGALHGATRDPSSTATGGPAGGLF